MAAGLAMAAAALAAAGPHGFADEAARAARTPTTDGRARPDLDLVRAQVRIADAETVRLLRPGDRVDVISAPDSGADASRVVSGARVVSGERTAPEARPDPEAGTVPGGAEAHAEAGEQGALIVLSVPRSSAAKLAGASLNSRLAVVVC